MPVVSLQNDCHLANLLANAQNGKFIALVFFFFSNGNMEKIWLEEIGTVNIKL